MNPNKTDCVWVDCPKIGEHDTCTRPWNPTSTTITSGVKHDSGKPMMSLLSATALTEVAKVMTFGAQKYAAHNWRLGFKWSRLMDGILRHLYSYNSGERQDPETGLSHLAHAVCGLMFLLEFEKDGVGEDDLWKGHKK